MECDLGDSFPFNFKPNGNPFGSENRKEKCHHDHIPFNLKGNGNTVFSVSLLHAEKYFLSLVDLPQIWVVNTHCRSVYHQTEFCLALNLLEKFGLD